MAGRGLFSAVLVFLAVRFALCCESTTSEKDWWETAQFYQIYPRSFKDSDGDGTGDLKGITDKLEYLKEIGVTATWLSPIFKSPMVDFGYDIEDFEAIDPLFGTMTDFENLLKKAKSLGIKVILDFVPNHSSDKSEWFKKSVNRQDGYDDFYVWHSGKPNAADPSRPLPPSNWLQAFRGSAWEWNDQRGQYYLHQFAVQQPDLNYRNPKVVERMKDVLRFWLGKGVDGFRIDAVPWVFEVETGPDGNYPDEPKSGGTNDDQESGYLSHIYTQDQPETVDMVYQWRKLMDDWQKDHGGDTRVIMTETYSELKYVMQFYGRNTLANKTDGAHIPFNFNFITRANGDSSAMGLFNAISLWMTQMPQGRVANWVMGNHDQRRVGSRYGQNRIDIMNMIALMLPGASITYMGEEIGMLDGQISWEDTKDPAACNSNRTLFEKFTRDPARTPFQWDDSVSAGFSSNQKTWLPVSNNYQTINVKSENAAVKSHLKVYKQLVNLRNTTTLKYGTVKYKALDNDILVIVRQLTEQKSYAMVANINNRAKSNVDISNVAILPDSMSYKILSVSSTRTAGQKVSINSLSLEPYESFILEE